jgi:hypothetical protein
MQYNRIIILTTNRGKENVLKETIVSAISNASDEYTSFE